MYGEFKWENVILQTNKEDNCHKIPFFEWFYARRSLRIAFNLIRLTELLETDQPKNRDRRST